jgi:Protein of unknown function (DUF1759)
LAKNLSSEHDVDALNMILMEKLRLDKLSASLSKILLKDSGSLYERPKLTRTTLQKFNGTPGSFPLFWNIYTDAIHERQDIKETEKFLYLLAPVKEPALLVIKHIKLGATGYCQAIDLLKQNHDNPVLTTIWSLITRANLKESTNQLRDIKGVIQKKNKTQVKLESWKA